MPEHEQIDIMGLLLNDDVNDDIEELELLNNLIFSDADNVDKHEAGKHQGELVWQEESDKFAISIWKLKGKSVLKLLPSRRQKYQFQDSQRLL